MSSITTSPSPYSKSVFQTLESLQKGVLDHVYKHYENNLSKINKIGCIFTVQSSLIKILSDAQCPTTSETINLQYAFSCIQPSKRTNCGYSSCDLSCLRYLVLGYEDAIIRKDQKLVEIISEVFQKGVAYFKGFKESDPSCIGEIDVIALNRQPILSANMLLVNEIDLTKAELQKEMQMVLHMMKSFICAVEIQCGTNSCYMEECDRARGFLQKFQGEFSAELFFSSLIEEATLILRMHRFEFPIFDFVPEHLLSDKIFRERIAVEEVGETEMDTETAEDVTNFVLNQSRKEKLERINKVIRESEEILRKEFEDCLNKYRNLDSLVVNDNSLTLNNLLARNKLINFRNKIKFGSTKEEYSQSRQLKAAKILTDVLVQKYSYKKVISFYSQKMPSSEETTILSEILRETKVQIAEVEEYMSSLKK